jgi:hypothetical protein
MNLAKLFVSALSVVLPATAFAEQAPSGPLNRGFAAFAYYFGGVAKASEGDLNGAIAQFNRLNPKDEIAYYNRGLLEANKGDFDIAIADFTCDPAQSYFRSSLQRPRISQSSQERHRRCYCGLQLRHPAESPICPGLYKPGISQGQHRRSRWSDRGFQSCRSARFRFCPSPREPGISQSKKG